MDPIARMQEECQPTEKLECEFHPAFRQHDLTFLFSCADIPLQLILISAAVT